MCPESNTVYQITGAGTGMRIVIHSPTTRANGDRALKRILRNVDKTAVLQSRCLDPLDADWQDCVDIE